MENCELENGNKKQFIISALLYDRTTESWRPVSKIVEMTKDEVVRITRVICMINGGSANTSQELGESLGSYMDPGKYRDIKVCMV